MRTTRRGFVLGAAALPLSSEATARGTPGHTMIQLLTRFDALRARCSRLQRRMNRDAAAWSRWSAETERRDALVAQVARMPADSPGDALIKTIIVAAHLLDDDALNDLTYSRRVQRLVRELRSVLAS